MVGRTVHQYQLLEKLGAGGMGEIYRAQDTRLNRFVAIKVLTQSNSGDPERRRRFIQEAQSASALNHPNIITIHDIVSEGDAQFLVMEHVLGKTMVDLIPKGGLRVPQVLKYSIQMADALQAAHSAGIIHRDLKPGNVMATDSGLVKVLDFGLAKLADRGPLSQMGNNSDATMTIADAPLTVEGAIIGTVSYMSPEQAQGRKVDSRSDIFSMGLVMYEMATGSRAFSGDSALSTLSAILRDEARSIAEIAPDVPPELEQVISRCLRKNPDDRWQTMKDLQQALSALKYDSDSGVLYRSRLSGIMPVNVPPPPQPSMQTPAMVPPPMYAPQAQPYAQQPPQYPPQQMQPQQQPPIGNPPSGWPPMQPPSQSGMPPNQMGRMPQQQKKSSAGLVIGLVAGAVILLGGAGGGAYWWTHRAKPEPVPEPPPVVAVEPAPAPAVETPPVPEPVAAAPDTTKAPETKAVPPPAPKQVAAVKSNPPPPATPQPAPKGQPQSTPPPPVAPPPAQATKTTPTVAPPPTPVAPKAAVAVAVNDGMPFTISLAQDIPDNAQDGQALKFIATRDFLAGDTVVIPQGATISGQIVEGSKKRLVGSSKSTLKLIEADIPGGGKLKVRALPSKRSDGKYERPVDTGVKQKNKDVTAAAGTEYIAYVDGNQTVSVRK